MNKNKPLNLTLNYIYIYIHLHIYILQISFYNIKQIKFLKIQTHKT